jgi:hypothetical protein
MPDDSIKVLTKGADSVIFPLLSKDFDPDESLKEKTIKDLSLTRVDPISLTTTVRDLIQAFDKQSTECVKKLN